MHAYIHTYIQNPNPGSPKCWAADDGATEQSAEGDWKNPQQVHGAEGENGGIKQSKRCLPSFFDWHSYCTTGPHWMRTFPVPGPKAPRKKKEHSKEKERKERKKERKRHFKSPFRALHFNLADEHVRMLLQKTRTLKFTHHDGIPWEKFLSGCQLLTHKLRTRTYEKSYLTDTGERARQRSGAAGGEVKGDKLDEAAAGVWSSGRQAEGKRKVGGGREREKR